MFTRIAVVNRGEPALRLTRAVRELNEERGYGIRVIALHTEAERRATFVRVADEAVVLSTGGSGSLYLDHAELGRALVAARADAAWVGWGSFASGIGGAPAAAVVFAGEVDKRTGADPRVRALDEALAAADEVEQAHLGAERALAVGSVHAIIPAAELRSRLIAAVERGIARAGG